jgi:putative ABC transport system ATP-binding protein
VADLVIDDLTVEYNSGGYVVRPIDSMSLSAPSGSLVLLLGPSGSGKTTLLSCLAGILSPTSGRIIVGDQNVGALDGEALTRYRRETVGIVFQVFNLIPSLTALENVEAPLRIAKVARREARERAAMLLERVGLADRMQHRPGDLSGGQQQRVAIARALAHDPPLLLADEPTAHLDYIQVEGILQLLRELAMPGRLLLVATHDDRLLPLADKVVEMVPKFTAHAAAPRRMKLEPGRLVFEQGSRSELVYVVEEGKVEIYRTRADRTEETVAFVGPGEYFGELGPMLGLPRTASARAQTPAVLTAMALRDFRSKMGKDRRIAALLGETETKPVTRRRSRAAKKPVRRGATASRKRSR